MSYIKQLLPEDYGFTPTRELVPQDDLDVVREEFLRRIKEYESYCSDHVINTLDAWSEADIKIVEGQHLKAGLEEKLNPVIQERFKAHRDATAFRNKLIGPVESGSQDLLQKMLVFRQAFDEEQAKDKARIEAVARARQEDECLKQAEEMEKAGAPAEAIDAVLDLAEDPEREIYHATPILRSKTTFRPAWQIEVVDESEVPEEYIIRTVNVAAIKKIVNAKKGNIKIRGIKIKQVEVTKRNK